MFVREVLACFVTSVLLPSVLWRCWFGGRKGIRPVKNLRGGVLAWLSVSSKVQTCIWPSWCYCPSLSLATVKSRLVLPFWYQLTRLVPEKGMLNGCVCVWVSHYRKSILRQTSDNLMTNRKIFCKSGPRSFIVGRDRTAQLLYKTLTAGGSVGDTACRLQQRAPPQRCSCWWGFRGNAKCIQRAACLTSHAIVVRRSQQPL